MTEKKEPDHIPDVGKKVDTANELAEKIVDYIELSNSLDTSYPTPEEKKIQVISAMIEAWDKEREAWLQYRNKEYLEAFQDIQSLQSRLFETTKRLKEAEQKEKWITAFLEDNPETAKALEHYILEEQSDD